MSDPTNDAGRRGFDLAGASADQSHPHVTVNYTGADPDPAGSVVFNEIMYNPLCRTRSMSSCSTPIQLHLRPVRLARQRAGLHLPARHLPRPAQLPGAGQGPGAFLTPMARPSHLRPIHRQPEVDGETLTLEQPVTVAPTTPPGLYLAVDRCATRPSALAPGTNDWSPPRPSN